MVIDLTNSEKTTFIRFLSLYLGSSFILMTLVAFLYYQNEKTLYFDLTKADMQNVTSKLSSKIISSHMTNTTLDTSKLLETKEYKISYYSFMKGNFRRILRLWEQHVIECLSHCEEHETLGGFYAKYRINGRRCRALDHYLRLKE